MKEWKCDGKYRGINQWNIAATNLRRLRRYWARSPRGGRVCPVQLTPTSLHRPVPLQRSSQQRGGGLGTSLSRASALWPSCPWFEASGREQNSPHAPLPPTGRFSLRAKASCTLPRCGGLRCQSRRLWACRPRVPPFWTPASDCRPPRPWCPPWLRACVASRPGWSCTSECTLLALARASGRSGTPCRGRAAWRGRVDWWSVLHAAGKNKEESQQARKKETEREKDRVAWRGRASRLFLQRAVDI